MLYSKPKDVRYVDMCIWIDANAYKEGKDEEKFFQYLYHLFYMLAYKNRYFYNSYEYDDFSVFAAIQLYQRYQKSKEDTKIRSVLNYIKSVIYLYKIQFQQQEYKENYYNKQSEEENGQDLIPSDHFSLYLRDQATQINKTNFKVYLDNLPRTIRQCVKHTPYKLMSGEGLNLYLSCLLTFLNSFTLSQSDMEKVNNIVRGDNIRENLYNKLYDNLSNEKIVYHLDNNMQDYVHILVKEISCVVRNELNYLINEELYTENIVTDTYSDICGESEDEEN